MIWYSVLCVPYEYRECFETRKNNIDIANRFVKEGKRQKKIDIYENVPTSFADRECIAIEDANFAVNLR